MMVVDAIRSARPLDLAEAAAVDDVQTVAALLAGGESPDSRSADGFTVLQLASSIHEDFGLTRDLSDLAQTHMVGSPYWMPPEMIKKEPHGLPVDIWSSGICTLELMNGKPPNRDNSLKAHDQYTETKTIWLDLSDRHMDETVA